MMQKESQDRRRDRAKVAVAAWTGDPLKLILRPIDSIYPLGFLVGVARALKREHVIGGGDDRVRLGRERLDPVAEVQTLFEEVRNTLFGFLNAGCGGKKLLERGDIA